MSINETLIEFGHFCPAIQDVEVLGRHQAF
jgi:hypothetical protein